MRACTLFSPTTVLRKSLVRADAIRPTRSLVLETLQEACKTEPERKCFRLVGGVLVERTVKDVTPQLESQYEQIKALLETLTSQYKTKVRRGAGFELQHDDNPADGSAVCRNRRSRNGSGITMVGTSLLSVTHRLPNTDWGPLHAVVIRQR